MIPRIDVTRGRFKKDFGRGFYLALQPQQVADRNAHYYDVVIGPTADDDTVIALQNYWKGIYGKVGSFEAKNALLNVLEVENLGTQCCLCTEKAVEVGVMTFGPVDWRIYE